MVDASTQNQRIYSSDGPGDIAYLVDSSQLRPRHPAVINTANAVSATKSWAPWIIGGLVVAGAAYWFTRD